MADENLYSGSSAAQIGAFREDVSIQSDQMIGLINRLIDAQDSDRVLDEERKKLRSETVGSAMMYDLELGMAHGSAIGGAYGGLIGLIGGGIRVAIDAIVLGVTLDDKLDDVLNESREVAERFKEAMDLREDIQSQIARYTSPLEQAMAARAKAFARQASAQGLSGAQALHAQFLNEQVYRAQVGASMPSVLLEAKQAALEEAKLKIQAIEKEYGISLALENRAVAQANQPSAAGKIAGGIANIATGLGSSIGFLAGAQKQTQTQTSEQQRANAVQGVRDDLAGSGVSEDNYFSNSPSGI